MNENEFRQKILTLQHKMYAMAIRIGLSPEDAADAVQETQLRLWRARHGLPDSPESLISYCFATLRNQAISILRQKKSTIRLDEISEQYSSTSFQETNEFEIRHHLELLIDRLPTNQQRVFRLKTFAGMDYLRIEQLTGLTQSNIRQLISRARKTLSKFIRHK